MDHPIIGVWIVDVRHEERRLVDRGTLHFDGAGAISLAFTDHAAHAVWSPSDDRSVVIRGARPVGPNEGFVGWYELRGTATVAEDGGTCHISASESRPRPDGTAITQLMTITGSRMLAAPEAG
jgi:hypothetical protein